MKLNHYTSTTFDTVRDMLPTLPERFTREDVERGWPVSQPQPGASCIAASLRMLVIKGRVRIADTIPCKQGGRLYVYTYVPQKQVEHHRTLWQIQWDQFKEGVHPLFL